jgi:DNA-binding transcriptional LysR family regulator
MLELHALRVFHEAATSGSFTAAARVLHMSQPAVSMQIRALEDYLQVALFDRQGRSVRLTHAGEALVPLARQMLSLAISTEETIREADGEMIGNMTIGCSVPSASRVLVHLVSRFQRLYKNVRISVPMASQDEILEKLRGDTYDLGVLSMAKRHDFIDSQPFFQDQIVLIAPTTHPFALAGEVEPQDLLAEQFVCQDAHSACRYAVSDAMREHGISIDDLAIVMEIGSNSAIIAAVEHGIGLSFVSLLEAAPSLAQGHVSIVRVQGFHLVTDVQLAAGRSHATNPIAQKFLAYVQHPQTQAHLRLLTRGTILEPTHA